MEPVTFSERYPNISPNDYLNMQQPGTLVLTKFKFQLWNNSLLGARTRYKSCCALLFSV